MKAYRSAAEEKQRNLSWWQRAETLIDNLKSFTAHYSSDNLETAVGGIDGGDGQTQEKQEKNRERFSDMLH